MYRMKEKSSQLIAALLLATVLAAGFALPVEAADAAAYAAVFDATYYAQHNPDVVSVLGSDPAQLFRHFLTYGMSEGRRGSAEFDPAYYIASNADLRAAFGNDFTLYYQHYLLAGKAEGRRGAADTAAPAQTTQSTPPGQTSQPAPERSTEDRFRAQVIDIVNQQRSANGLSPLSSTDALMSAAQVRAGEIVTLFAHQRPDGRSIYTAMDEAGAPHGWAGENIAAGQSSPESVMNSWMNSSGHRANILRDTFHHIGVGCVSSGGRYYWVQMFTD